MELDPLFPPLEYLQKSPLTNVTPHSNRHQLNFISGAHTLTSSYNRIHLHYEQSTLEMVLRTNHVMIRGPIKELAATF